MYYFCFACLSLICYVAGIPSKCFVNFQKCLNASGGNHWGQSPEHLYLTFCMQSFPLSLENQWGLQCFISQLSNTAPKSDGFWAVQKLLSTNTYSTIRFPSRWWPRCVGSCCSACCCRALRCAHLTKSSAWNSASHLGNAGLGAQK